MHLIPYYAQKTIFKKFEKWGMGLGRFQNLSLIYEMMAKITIGYLSREFQYLK